jgi:hypothetical protein
MFQRELRDLSTVASVWSSVAREDSTKRDPRVAAVVSSFPDLQGDALYKQFSGHANDFAEKGFSRFVIGSPVTSDPPSLYPVAMICVGKRGDSLRASVRVVTYYELDESVRGIGWRLDLADLNDENRTSRWNGTAHVQRINNWRPGDAPGFIEALDEAAGSAKPAFPLPVKTPAGLLIAAMVSLYGTEASRKMLDGVTLQRGREDLDAVTGG